MPRRIFRQILADAVEVRAASSKVGLQLAAEHWQKIKHFFGSGQFWIDQYFTGESNSPGLYQESKRESRGQAEALLIAATTPEKLSLPIANVCFACFFQWVWRRSKAMESTPAGSERKPLPLFLFQQKYD